jgi:hypothetical protein
LRVLSERHDGARYRLRVEGRAGRTYALRVRPPRGAPSAVTVLPAQLAMSPLRMSEPDHEGWVTVSVEFPSQGGDADDYIELELSFASD